MNAQLEAHSSPKLISSVSPRFRTGVWQAPRRPYFAADSLAEKKEANVKRYIPEERHGAAAPAAVFTEYHFLCESESNDDHILHKDIHTSSPKRTRDRGSLPTIDRAPEKDALSRKERLLSIQFAKNQFEAFRKDEEFSISDLAEENEPHSTSYCSGTDYLSSVESSSELSFDPPLSGGKRPERNDSMFIDPQTESQRRNFSTIKLHSSRSPVECLTASNMAEDIVVENSMSTYIFEKIAEHEACPSRDCRHQTTEDSVASPALDFLRQQLSDANEGVGPNMFGDFLEGAKPSKREVWRYIYDSWLLVATGLLGSLGNGTIFPLFAYCFADFIGVLSLPSAWYIEQGIWEPTRNLILVAVGCFAANAIQHSFLETAGQGLVRNLRFSLFNHIVHLPACFFDQKDLEPGYLLNLLSVDTLLIKGWALDNPALIVQNVCCVVCAVIIAWNANMRLALVSIAGFLSVGPAQFLQTKFMSSESKPVIEAGDDGSSTQLLAETLKCSKTVDAFNLHTTLAARFDRYLVRERRAGRRLAVTSGFFYGLAQFCQFGSQALSLWYGGRSFAKGTIKDAAEMMQGTFTLIIAAMGIGQSASGATEGAKGKAAAQRVFSLLAVPVHPDIRDSRGVTAQDVLASNAELKGDFQFKRIHFRFPAKHSVPVYKDLSFHVPGGKSVALVGESGCGKTTLIQLIERFYEIPAESAILFGGVDIREWNLKAMRSRISLVSQEPILFNDTIANNIRYGKLNATMEEIQEAAQLANAEEFIREQPDGYETVVGVRGEKLSGGQRQRIALARALIKDSDVLLLDEATSALDSVSEKVVQAAIDDIIARTRKTVFVVAHRLSTIKNADMIVMLKKKLNSISGESEGSCVAELGTHRELMLRPDGAYFALVQASQRPV
eukprot:Gregarina_sp_Poly_1__1326@NODE_1328_length_4370_cov_45_596328_g433_i1_p1_GENE_NODE_1328_length_4370_cov_45_596328_g433_i1NODE_1328_length_4370_cov_45_596328_g433_i1_p1_ORF_typecomplete_len897_score148_30ABC_membrane/PF00664_23/2e39ABC_tran/PF00005_27/1_3e38SMC_N/PF02463_19/52SMC_N/PF02463_19/0_00052AAA_21/PF13304_6/3_7e03AAA_21/PF13304_6/0_00011AAA_5/PF07728_14/0_0016AAA_22/PF13401_6/2_7e03AAA_22/PF13401_6/0_025AAA/PF00004_29/0_0065PduVEutP/PF10662_9/0_0083AAA_15/PF13175_6/5_1e03AAA_15/PF13175_6